MRSLLPSYSPADSLKRVKRTGNISDITQTRRKFDPQKIRSSNLNTRLKAHSAASDVCNPWIGRRYIGFIAVPTSSWSTLPGSCPEHALYDCLLCHRRRFLIPECPSFPACGVLPPCAPLEPPEPFNRTENIAHINFAYLRINSTMSSGFVTRMLWTYWRQEMSRVRAASAVRNDSSTQALQTNGKDDDDWTLRGMFNTGLDLRRSGLQRAQTLVRDSDFETATMSSQELFTALEVTICTVIWIDLKLLLHGNLLERHLVSPIPDDAVENILHAVNYEAGRHLDRRWDSQRMFPSNSTARDVDQLVLDCCAVDMH